MYRPVVIGADPAPTPEEPQPLTISILPTAVVKIVVVGIATGAAFAIGAALAERYVIGRRRGR